MPSFDDLFELTPSVIEAAVAAALAGRSGPPWSGAADPPAEVFAGEAFDGLVEDGVNVLHPFAAAHLHAPTLAAAAAAELVIGATNQSMDSFDQAPSATAAEDVLVRWMAGLLGLPSSASGVMTSGGTASNLHGLLLARDAAAGGGTLARAAPLVPGWESWRIVCSSLAHFSVRRAAALLGLGTSAVVPVAADACGRMSVEALDDALSSLAAADLRPICVVATAGTTDHGAIDPLRAVSERARACGAWLHVDACVGAGLAFSPRLRGLLDGVSTADSVAADLHKLGWLPIGASLLLVRDGAVWDAVREPSDYLDREEDIDAGVVNLVARSLDTSRRFDALKALVAFRAAGERRMGEMVEHVVDLASYAASAIQERPDDFELVCPPSTVCVLFRLRRGDPAAVQRALFSRAEAIVGRTRVDGVPTLKLTCVNPLTTRGDVDALLDLVAREARQV